MLHAYQLTSPLSLQLKRPAVKRRARMMLKGSSWENFVTPTFDHNPRLELAVLVGIVCELGLYCSSLITDPVDFGRDFTRAHEQSGRSLCAVSRITGIHRNTLKRIMDGRTDSTLGTLCSIVRVYPSLPDLHWRPACDLGPPARQVIERSTQRT
ncbi:MAG: hypothetical protein ACPG4T_15585 [Nannocystaceae bacterium]